MGSAVTKITYTHDAMVDLILQEPTVTNKELGELFGYSPGWVARVIASDAFVSRIAERKAQLIDPQITQSLNERLRGVAIHAVDIISQKLDAEQSAGYAIDALGLATKAMGLGKRG
jgi:hypothetical protein